MRRFSTLAVLTALVLIVGLAADWILLRPIRETDDLIRSTRHDLAVVTRQISAARTSLQEAAAASLPPDTFTIGPTNDATDAGFQEQVRTALADAGAMVLASQVSTTQIGGGFRKTSLLFQAQATETTLLAFLDTIQQAQPLIYVEGLDLSALSVELSPGTLELTATLVRLSADDPQI